MARASVRNLITGGAGFLGSHLAEALLKRGQQVTILDVHPRSRQWKINHLLAYPKLDYRQGSVLNKGLMDQLVKGCDRVFHFGAIVGVEHYVARPYDVLNVNVNGTRIVLDCAYKYKKKIIFASTSEIYGKNKAVPFKEDSDRVLGPTSIDRWCYSSSKAVGEHFCFAYYEKGLPTVILRFFNAYGPRLDSIEAGRIMSIFMGQLMRGKPLTVIGDGRQTRCFTYVDDIVDGIIRAADVEGALGKVFNLGTNVETRIIDLAKLMVELYGDRSADITFIKSEGKYGLSYEDIPRRVPDISRAKRILGFRPSTPLKVGLARTMEWFREHYSKIQRERG